MIIISLQANEVSSDRKRLTLCMLKKPFSRRHFEIYFLFFSENRLWLFMQIVPRDTICINC